MNKIYRRAWSAALGRWIVASEWVNGWKDGTASRWNDRHKATWLLLMALCAGWVPQAGAQSKNGGLVLGDGATADGSRSVAIGKNATANGAPAGSIAVGENANAGKVGSSTIAIGNGAVANNTIAGSGDAMAIGVGAKATGTDSTAIGAQTTANAANTIAIGNNGTAATAQNAVALGISATAGTANSVALGNRSTTRAATAVASGNINKVKYQYAGSAPAGVVSIGDVGQERQLQNVAAGGVSSSSTDAVNGSQLHATNQAIESVAKTANAGWNLSAQGANESNIAPGQIVDLNNKDGNIVVSKAKDSNAVTFDLADDVKIAGSVKVGGTTLNGNGVTIMSGPSITKAGIDAGGTVIKHVAAGVEGGDAANVDQVSQSIDAARTRFYSVNNSDEGEGNFNNDGASGTDALAAGVGAVASGQESTSTGVRNTAEGDYSTAMGYVNTAMGENSSAVGNFNLAEGAGSNAFGRGNTVVGKQGNAFGSDNDVEGEGATALGNGAQVTAAGGLALGNDTVVTQAGSVALGAGSKTDQAVGTANAVIGGVTYGFAGANPKSTVSVGSAGNERTVTNVAAGRLSASSSDAVNGSQLHATNQAIDTLDDRVDSVAGDVRALDGRVSNVEGDVTKLGNTINNINVDIRDVKNGADGVFQVSQETPVVKPTPKGNNAAAGGSGAVASGDDSLAVGNQAVAGGDQSTAIGQGAQATHDHSVALGQGSKTTVGAQDRYQGVYAGDSDSTGEVNIGGRKMTGVAAGSESSDAVNVRQLQGGVNNAIEKSNAYTDLQIGRLHDDVWQLNDDLRKDMHAGVASALAVKQAPWVPGRTTFYAGLAGYKDQGAVGLSVRRTADSGHWSLEGGFTTNRDGNGAYVGVSGVLGAD